MTPGVTCSVVRTRHIATRDQERAAAEHAEHVYQVVVAHLAGQTPTQHGPVWTISSVV